MLKPSFPLKTTSPPTAPFTNQRGRLGGSTGYPSFKDEEGKGYDKRGVPLANPLLSSYRKRITGTFGVREVMGLGGEQGLDGLIGSHVQSKSAMNGVFCR